MENEKKQLLVGFLEDFLDKKQMIDKFLGKNGCIKIK
jgi:hypothetical protein